MDRFSVCGAGILTACLTMLLQTQAVREPQYGMEFHYLTSSGDLVLLEKAPAQSKLSGGRLLINKTSRLIVIEGKASSVRFPASRIPRFIVKGLPSQQNPQDLVQILKFDTTRNTRELVIATQGGLAASSTPAKAQFIPLAFEPYGTQSTQITVKGEVPPGEYCTGTGTQFMYCFGVDK